MAPDNPSFIHQGEHNEETMRFSFKVRIPERVYELMTTSQLEQEEWLAVLRDEVQTNSLYFYFPSQFLSRPYFPIPAFGPALCKACACTCACPGCPL